jgi:hypothetical protein
VQRSQDGFSVSSLGDISEVWLSGPFEELKVCVNPVHPTAHPDLTRGGLIAVASQRVALA